MANLSSRITLLEQRRPPAGACPELIVLRGDEEMTPHQQAEIERAARHNLPTLTLRIGKPRIPAA
ncbi:MAG: hypothetical protein WAW10_02685 [Gallionella sp.]